MTRLGLRHVATYLDVSNERARQLYRAGRLPPPMATEGRSALWDRAAIEAWAEREWWGKSRTPWRRG